MYSREFHVRLSYRFFVDHLSTGGVKRHVMVSLNVASNCWICEGWQTIKFTLTKPRVKECLRDASEDEAYKTQVMQPGGKYQLTVYLSYDGYKPHHMTALRDVKGNESYAVTLMVPPGNLNYFYQAVDDSAGVKGSEATILTDQANPTFNAEGFQAKLDHGTVEVPRLNY